MPSAHELFASWPIACRLPLRFDAEHLAADLAAMRSEWWSVHRGPYHDGSWEMIPLLAPNGDLKNQTTKGGAFERTAAGAACRSLDEVLSRFPAKLNRVRFLRLRAGGRILPHSDPMADVDPNLIRIHIPVQTNSQVLFRVHGLRVEMREGEAWFVDVRFRHEVFNGGDSHRVHLVVDLIRNAAIEELMARSEAVGRARLTSYLLKHSLPPRIKRWARIGN